jgi:hypothetical protein
VCEVVQRVVDIDGLSMGWIADGCLCQGWTASPPPRRAVTVSPRCEVCATRRAKFNLAGTLGVGHDI